MKKKLVTGLLFAFMILTSITNIMSISKSNKLLGSVNPMDLTSGDVPYKNSKSVQSAIDEVYASASDSFLDRMYPVGAIFLTTSLTSADQVHEALGGTWESYGKGRTLVGMGSNGTTNYTTVSQTGGSESQSYTPAGTNTGGSVGNHTLTIAEMPSHSHTLYGKVNATGFGDVGFPAFTSPGGTIITTDQITATGGGGAHNHPFTNPTFTGTAATISHMQPYITVYMYKRVS